MLKSTYTPPPPLPPGWTEHKAPSGHTYYYNAQTKQSTYTRPQPLAVTSQHAPPAPAPVPSYTPEFLPPFSSTPYGPQGYGFGDQSFDFSQHGQTRQEFRGGKGYRDRRGRGPEDRPKSKHPIPGCEPWVLVKTRLRRRFVHNPETQESFWKIPAEVMKGVVEYDRLEREERERKERGEEVEEPREDMKVKADETGPSDEPSLARDLATTADAPEESDEYEEVEVTDSEEEDVNPSKRTKTEDSMDKQHPLEFTEEDIEYQLAAMGEEYGLDPGEYGDPGQEGWEEGAEGLPLTEEDATALFRDLLDDYRINPYSTWEKIIEEGHIIEDSRYTALPNMKARREVWSNWSRDRIQELKERKEKQEKRDPRIRYFAFLQEHATPKLYWPEFKRKFRKESEMKDSQLSDKDREKYYRDLVSRLKQSESTRKSDFSALLKSVPLQELNRSTDLEALPSTIITDLRYIALPSKVRDPLLETYISTLAPPPEQHLTSEELEELSRKKIEREKREKALAEREKRVQEEKRKQHSNLIRGKHLLREGEAEIEEAMRVKKEGLRSYLEAEEQISTHSPQEKSSDAT
ncbi:FF domain protein [Aspergillus clavatus NRRL 1]|uniref:FF domain protein n=1 Tax=Aspergillus clavatus (strain ATCC 1007 / CBS 513.65 / DSM 816 / NCTC 3887 / NRRL 1 / QM 1276 / 107) TaxID=344612 RepID=A1CTL1_ASPCL|nr:FF domain protein [Aspergillus clavatus NRRL 1]EAW06648.1 FF domain protein [Aspergillus clavatus NRRL 1]